MVMAPLDRVDEGEHFTSLPLHITVLPWFTMNWHDWGKFDGALRDRLDEERFGSLIIGGEEYFSSDKDHEDIPVAVVAGQLFGVHAIVHSLASSRGVLFDETHMGLNWRPHISGFVGEVGSHIRTAGLAVVRKQTDYKDVKAFYEWNGTHETKA